MNVQSILMTLLSVSITGVVVVLAQAAKSIHRLERDVAALAHERDCPGCREKLVPGTPGGGRGRVIQISSASSPEDLAQKISDAIKTEMIRREEGL